MTLAIITIERGGNLKKLILLLLACTIIFSPGQCRVIDKLQCLQSKLEENGVKIKREAIYFEAHIKSKQNLQNTYLHISKLLQIENFDKTIPSKLDPKPVITIKAFPTDKENVFYITVMLSQQNSIKNINNIIGNILKMYKEFEIEPDTYYGFEGFIQKKLSKAQMKTKASEILLSCDSKNISGIEEGEMVSLYGVSPIFSKCLNMNGVNENLNIAMRFIKEKKITELWAYSPLIQMEY